MKSEAQQGTEIMSMVNEITASKIERVRKEIVKAAGAEPKLLDLVQISPLQMTVGFGEEIAAYKLAYAYREHFQSRVRVEVANGPAAAEAGPYLVIIQPKA